MKTAAGILALALAALPPLVLFRVARARLVRHQAVVSPYLGVDAPVLVDVPVGASATAALRLLEQAGVLRDARLAGSILNRAGLSRGIRAGEYRFERALTPIEVLEKLLAGDVFTRRVTFPEGLNRFEMAARFERAGLGRAADFLAATGAPAAVADLDPAATDLEGYLFPSTYDLTSHESAERLVERMVLTFRSVVGEGAVARSQALGLTLRQVVTLASIVEKETARAAERPLVAGVYLARLGRGMLLQADPTVIYGLVREGRFDGNLTRVHLREDAPYNTYVRSGLPPGPIANPGAAALAAAFAPALTDRLYFVSRNDGSHVFSRSLAEHNRSVQSYQRDYWREVRRRSASARADGT